VFESVVIPELMVAEALVIVPPSRAASCLTRATAWARSAAVSDLCLGGDGFAAVGDVCTSGADPAAFPAGPARLGAQPQATAAMAATATVNATARAGPAVMLL
jgi:hypothetical protein